MQDSCTLEGFSFATWRMAAVCGDGDSCPQLSAWPPGLWGCGTTQQRLCSATLIAIFPISSPFMYKAGKTSKGFTYLQVLEKWFLDFKMGLKDKFISFTLKLFSRCWQGTRPICFTASSSTADLDQELLSCCRGLAWRWSVTFHNLHCFLHLYFTTQSQSALSIGSIVFFHYM